MRIQVIADCSPAVGLGHLKRCIVLASAFRTLGHDVVVSTPEAYGRSFVEQAGLLSTSWPDNLDQPEPSNILIADGYAIPVEVMRRWKHMTDVRVFMDDLASSEIDADIVVNPNLFATELNYDRFQVPTVLLGPKYALIDQNFFRKKKISCRPLRIAVSFGGTDTSRLALEVTRRLLVNSADSRVCVVFSPFYSVPEAAEALVAEFGSRLDVRHGADLSEVFAVANLYVGAAGTTILEAAASRLSIIAIPISDNQKKNGEKLRKLGVDVIDVERLDLLDGLIRQRKFGSSEKIHNLISNDGPAQIANVAIEKAQSLKFASRMPAWVLP